MEEQLHAVLNSELGEGTDNGHAWATVRLQQCLLGWRLMCCRAGLNILENKHLCPSRKSNKDASIAYSVA